MGKNIRAGWQASGLWPVNMAKSLMSRLLFENSNNSTKEAQKWSAEEPLSEWNVD